MLILAIDLGMFKSVFCKFDSLTGEDGYGTIRTDSLTLRRTFERERPELIVVESGSLAALAYDVATEMGLRILVADTTQDAWRWKNVKRKTDKDDALKIARLAALNQIHPVHMPAPAVRQWRQLIEHRQAAVHERTRCKNRIRNLVRCHAELFLKRGRGGWTVDERKRIEALRKPLSECGQAETWRGLLDFQLMCLANADWVVIRMERALDAIGGKDERVQRLQSLPGVGPRVAEVLVSSLDKAERFQKGRQVGAYAGLTPKQFDSGQMQRSGKISKRGRPVLRYMLCQAAWTAVRKDERFREVFTHVCRGSKKRRKVAIVAVMRRLLIVAWAMLRDGTRYRPRGAPVETKVAGPSKAAA